MPILLPSEGWLVRFSQLDQDVDDWMDHINDELEEWCWNIFTEKAQAPLAERSIAFRASQERMTAKHLAAALPEGAALADHRFDEQDAGKLGESDRREVEFVVRRGAEPVRGDLGKADAGVARGMKGKDAPQPDGGGRLPPDYWAGFVLSGDWR